jgi:hypothetical protein
VWKSRPSCPPTGGRFGLPKSFAIYPGVISLATIIAYGRHYYMDKVFLKIPSSLFSQNLSL